MSQDGPEGKDERRRRKRPRSKTVAIRTRWHGSLAPTLTSDEEQILRDSPRPRTRADCEPCDVCQAHAENPDPFAIVDGKLPCGHLAEDRNHCRPCPWAGCKNHLFLDVNESGSIKFNHPRVDLVDMADTCALDLAARGGVTLEVLGSIVNVTRERARQIETKMLVRLRKVVIKEGIVDADEAEAMLNRAMRRALPGDPITIEVDKPDENGDD